MEERDKKIIRAFKKIVKEDNVPFSHLNREFDISWYLYDRLILKNANTLNGNNIIKLINFIEVTKGDMYLLEAVEEKNRFNILREVNVRLIAEDMTFFIKRNGRRKYEERCDMYGIAKVIYNRFKFNTGKCLPIITLVDFIKICKVINTNPTKYLCK